MQKNRPCANRNGSKSLNTTPIVFNPRNQYEVVYNAHISKMRTILTTYIVSSSSSHRNRNIFSVAVIFVLIFNIIYKGD